MRKLVMIAAAATAGWLGAAAAAEPPAYLEGEAFVFDDGRVEQVRKVEGERVVWATRGGRTYTRAANPILPILEWNFRDQSGVRELQGDLAGLWPPQPGARVRFRSVNTVRTAGKARERRSLELYTCWVGDAAPAVTPAGRFPAYPIVCDRYSPATMRVLDRTTWLYASDVGHYVRRENVNMRIGGGDAFSLYATVPPREANPVRIEAVAADALALKDAAAAGPPAP